MNTLGNVNIRPLQGFAVERSFAAKLRDLLGRVTWLKEVAVEAETEPLWDLTARISLPAGKTAVLAVECKKELRPSQFPIIAARFADALAPRGKEFIVPVLALPWISPRMAELCAEYGWSWYDLAGNCHLDVPGLLRISRTGHAPVHEVPKPRASLKSWAAAAVVGAVLNPKHARRVWTQRHIQLASSSDVSLGLVNKVVRHLMDEAFVEALPEGGFHLSDPVRLLHAWRDAYRFEKHERLGCFTLMDRRKLTKAIAKLGEDGMDTAYAAFSAADLLAPHVRQPKTWVYVSHRQVDQFMKETEAKRVDSGDNLVVLIPADECVLDGQVPVTTQGIDVRCTSAIQTYVDLWHCGGRGQEAAEAVMEQKLKPAWMEAGMKL